MSELTKLVAAALSDDVRRRADLSIEEATSEEKAEIALKVIGGAVLEPGRWWRVIDADEKLWCETSSEDEARGFVRPGDRLQRRSEGYVYEWFDVKAEPVYDG
jgi:hypothetical protein